MNEAFKKYLVCLVFSVDLFVLIWLTEIFRNVINAMSAGLTSGIFQMILLSVVIFFLFVFGIVPSILLAMWLLNPLVIRKLLTRFNLTEDSLEKEEKHEEIINEQNMSKGKRDWQKYLLAVSIIGLITSSLLTAGLTFYSFQLTEQANRIAEKSVDLQIMQSNYTTTIITDEVTTVLDQNGYYANRTDLPTESSGWLNGSIKIITPHIGRLFISIANFTISDDYSSLIPEKVNDTIVYFDTGYNVYDPNDYAYDVSNEGFNVVDFSIPLIAEFYPNPEKIPDLPESATIYPIGFLRLEAKLVTQTGLDLPPEYFWAHIFVIVRNNF